MAKSRKHKLEGGKVPHVEVLDELAMGAGLDSIAPFWRTTDPSSPLAGKLSCGAAFIEQPLATAKRG